VYRFEQLARAGDRRARSRVEDLDPGPPRRYLSGIGRDGDIPAAPKSSRRCGDGVVEQLLVRLAALPHPDDVVTPVQAVEGTVELGHAGAGRFISHASKHRRIGSHRTAHVRAAVGPETGSRPTRRLWRV
jgi:hypothetical protein